MKLRAVPRAVVVLSTTAVACCLMPTISPQAADPGGALSKPLIDDHCGVLGYNSTSPGVVKGPSRTGEGRGSGTGHSTGKGKGKSHGKGHHKGHGKGNRAAPPVTVTAPRNHCNSSGLAGLTGNLPIVGALLSGGTATTPDSGGLTT